MHVWSDWYICNLIGDLKIEIKVLGPRNAPCFTRRPFPRGWGGWSRHHETNDSRPLQYSTASRFAHVADARRVIGTSAI